MKNWKTDAPESFKEKDALEKPLNKRIFDEVKNGFKNKFANESPK
jgi:hypothetical protein